LPKLNFHFKGFLSDITTGFFFFLILPHFFFHFRISGKISFTTRKKCPGAYAPGQPFY